MSSRTPPHRFAHVRNVLVGLLAVLLVALYGFAHRAELGQIFHELREDLLVGSHGEAAVNSARLEPDSPQSP